MNPTTLKPLIVPGYKNESPATSLRSVVRKSALFNLTIVLTYFRSWSLQGDRKLSRRVWQSWQESAF